MVKVNNLGLLAMKISPTHGKDLRSQNEVLEASIEHPMVHEEIPRWMQLRGRLYHVRQQLRRPMVQNSKNHIPL